MAHLAQGYLVKPVTVQAIRREYEYYLMVHSTAQQQAAEPGRHRLKISTFGNFELFVDGRPVVFKRRKAKELLAYLVDRNGSMVEDDELLEMLWGKHDRSAKSHLRSVKAELMGIFADAGYKDAISKHRGMMGILPDKVDCDFFDAINSTPPDMHNYKGEYSRQYSWSEQTRTVLDNI